MYVSVHATQPDLRTLILDEKTDDLNTVMRSFAEDSNPRSGCTDARINDGNHLEDVYDLYRLYPGVESVAIVLLGLSDYGKPRSD
jgi:NifB/MoaA-like Fe-S oxidoreductase